MADDVGVTEEATGDLEEVPVFVRTISLPTTSLRNAKAAVELQFDRLSPLPRSLADFDVVALRSAEGRNQYAVGIVSKSRLIGGDARGRRIQVSAVVEGKTVVFKIRNHEYVAKKAKQVTRASPSIFVVVLTLVVLASALDYRLTKEVSAARASVNGLEKAAVEVRQKRADQQSAWSDWTAVAGDRLARSASCALQRIAKAGEPTAVALFEAGTGATHVLFASPLSEGARDRIDPQAEFTWMDDGDSRSQGVRFGSSVCA